MPIATVWQREHDCGDERSGEDREAPRAARHAHQGSNDRLTGTARGDNATRLIVTLGAFANAGDVAYGVFGVRRSTTGVTSRIADATAINPIQ